jgi:hypothetical protein
MVDKEALGQVFSKYLCFPCQYFHRLLHTHHRLSSRAGTIGQIVGNVRSGLSLRIIKATPTYDDVNTNVFWSKTFSFSPWFSHNTHLYYRDSTPSFTLLSAVTSLICICSYSPFSFSAVSAFLLQERQTTGSRSTKAMQYCSETSHWIPDFSRVKL